MAFGVGDRGLDRGGVERLAVGEADVLEELGDGVEQMEQFARGLAALDQRGEHLQAGDEPVAGGRIVAEDDVPRLLAADIAAARAHRLQDVAVADLGSLEGDAILGEAAFKTEVGHDGSDDCVARENAAAMMVEPDQRHQLVAVDDGAFLVDDDQPVGIAIEREADRGA